ncbi:MAG TPA: Fic family protein [Candidatus Paceibacterota bacterium]|nr:Fic family protein [Candidatus Paceibacterota bacterium]
MTCEQVPLDQLRHFVRQSNAIEGYGALGFFLAERFRDPAVEARYFDGHMAAARMVAADPRSALRDPRIIHRILYRELGKKAGTYRTTELMRVGERIMPHPQHVAALMEQWVCAATAPCPCASDPAEAAGYALMLHNAFLCIHPFVDGNGRTARLLLNALRLTYGAPWITIYAGNEAYYAQLERFEDEVFRPQYADTYPSE